MMFGTSRIMNIISKQKQKITPLYIIGAFVTLTEGVLGYAIIHTTSYVQIALMLFVFFYAFFVAIAFFTILWCRPYVLYAPSEYENVDPESFINTIRGDSLSPKRAEQIKLASEVVQNPENKDAENALIYSLLSSNLPQLIILMYERGVSLPNEKKSKCYCYYGKYKYGKIIQRGNAEFEIRHIVRELKYTKYLKVVRNKESKVVLTKRGKNFAKWMVRNGKKKDYFTCEYGSWGKVPPDVLEQIREDKEEL